jgi:hypothetical protein
MGLFRRRSREDEVARTDALTLQTLQQNGADLSLPRHVLHYLYYPTREAADAAANALRAEGLIVVVDRAAVGSTWLARAETNAIVSVESCALDRARFTALARAGGGEYDGWEASASP